MKIKNMSALVKRCQQVLTSLNYEALYIHELLIASDFFLLVSCSLG